MDHALSIFLFLFSGALFLYALLLAATKDSRLIVRDWAAEMKDKRAYAARFAGVMAVVAAAPALAGLVGLIWEDAAVPVLIAGTAAAIWIGTKMMKGVL